MYNIAECGSCGSRLKYASEERKAESIAKQKATVAKRTKEEKAKISAKQIASFANRGMCEAAEINARRKATKANWTAEEVTEIYARRSAVTTVKFYNIVEDTINLCLQNRLFTFGKYKKYCTANNIVMLVSVSYFGKLMYFATNNNKLQEFIAVYNEGMDYNTYTTLCNLKPISILVFLVAVKHSTYKYFI